MQERSVSISTQTILKIILTILVLMFLWAVRDIIALVFTALILAALINPLAQWGARWKIPKGISVVAFYIIFFGGLALSFVLVMPELLQQIGKLGTSLDRSWRVLSNGVAWLKTFSEQYGLSDNLQAGITSLQMQINGLFGRLFSTVSGLFGGLVALVIVLVMAYYMVVQEDEALKWFKNFIPDEYDAFVTRMLVQVQDKFGHWLAGQLVLCAIVGVLYYIGLRIFGVEGALVLALLGAFTEFIPYVGPILGAIPAVIVAATQSPTLAVATIILYVLVQQTETHILVPKVMERAVGINPIVSIVALLIGGSLFGIPGAILAIPVATACSVVLMEIWKFQKKA